MVIWSDSSVAIYTVAYFNNFLDEIGLENRDGKSVRNKVINLKQEYDKASKWKKETVKGVEDEQSLASIIIRFWSHNNWE